MTVDRRVSLWRKNVIIVGIIRFGNHGKELLEWALEREAGPGDSVVAIHVCKNSGCVSYERALLDGCLKEFQDLCYKKKVGLSGEVLKGNSIRRVLVDEARNRSASAVIVGITKQSRLGGYTSIAKYCANRLPSTTNITALHNGRIIFSRSSKLQSEDNWSEFGGSEVSEMSSRYSVDVSSRKRGSLRSISLPVEDFTKDRPGWPLLLTASSTTQPTKDARKLSVVKWVMSLPRRSLSEYYREREKGEESESGDNLANHRKELRRDLGVTRCEVFSYDVLEESTREFSPGNLIGKGGCNSVYKGILPDGKHVAIKILESSKESRKDFMRDVDIMTTVKHKNIAPLLGICMKSNELISVYDFFSKGNLDENLQSDSKGNSVLTWDVRFQIAIGIAEALNYLHNECSKPVIHRDVKSSNILLTNDLEPRLCDFGLAMWGPTTSSFVMDSDVVGTFGYMAPEYFMYGRVSDKIDVYAFGVVLLELLSGRKPIGLEGSKSQESLSLVMWAKPMLENGDLKGILDPNLDGDIVEIQVQRMALAARLCLNQASRLRPKMSQVLHILNGEEYTDGITPLHGKHDDLDDEVYPLSRAESHLSLAFLDVNDNSASFRSSLDQSSPLSVEEYLRKRWSAGSNLD